MGMTFCTLHLFAVERDALVKKLAPGDLLREQNAPWLSLVPVYDPEHVETQRLEKLAKALTKGTPQAAALLFSYFDDERFLCSFFRDGRKQAACLSQESWAKLGKKLDELFGDTSATKAFRYAARCFDLEEQVRLLEDSVGATLYDFPEEEQPRRVSRSDRTLREVKAREAAQKKRLGLENIRPIQRDASKPREDLRETMDAVLLDAPCSGLGVMAEKPDIKLRVTEESIRELTELQAKLLDTVCAYVRPGGVLVYSTCSLLKDENEHQIRSFLEKHPEYTAESLPETIPENFRKQENLGLQLMPHRDGVEGFYICRLRRRADF